MEQVSRLAENRRFQQDDHNALIQEIQVRFNLPFHYHFLLPKISDRKKTLAPNSNSGNLGDVSQGAPIVISTTRLGSSQ